MQLYYYVQRGDQQFGPYLSDVLLDYIAQGNIILSDLVYLDDSQTWSPLENTPLIQNMLQDAGLSATDHTELPAEPTTEVILDAAMDLSPDLPAVPRRPVTIEPELNLEMIEPDEEAETVSEVVTPAPAPMKAALTSETSSQLLDLIFTEGVASIEIEQTGKGLMTVAVEDGQSDALTIEVRAARAVRLTIESETRAAVGDLASVIVTAVDEFGNIDETCQAELTIKYSGSAMGVARIQLKDGIGNFGVSNEKATVSSFVVAATGDWSDLQATDGAVDFFAGPAIRFEIVAPTSLKAGERAQVQVLARDQFGNQTSRVEADVRLAIQHFVS